jgi:hypothetical protein
MHLALQASLRYFAQHQVPRPYELRHNLLVFPPSSLFPVGRC